MVGNTCVLHPVQQDDRKVSLFFSKKVSESHSLFPSFPSLPHPLPPSFPHPLISKTHTPTPTQTYLVKSYTIYCTILPVSYSIGELYLLHREKKE